jgi:hypothetical protein
MLNHKINKYWMICFKFCTPFLAILIAIITIASNGEVVLGTYRYPTWAHIIGWIIVLIIMSPIIKYFVSALYHSGILRDLYAITQPRDDWKPAFDAPLPAAIDLSYANMNENKAFETEESFCRL